MRHSVLVAEYLDALTHELRFDLQLSRRIRQEVEDHLLQSIADEQIGGAEDNRDGGANEAARRAIARFGDAREIARQYASLSLLRQARRVGAFVIVAIATILVLMKARGAAYELLQWRLSADWLGIATLGPAITRYAFQAALVVGVLGWVYIASRRVSPILDRFYRRQLKRCLLLSIAAESVLIGSVMIDSILGGLRLAGAGLSPAALIPVLSIGLELALIGIVAVELRNTIRGSALVASIFAEGKGPERPS